MVVTFPTCHVERSPLKAPADSNTAPQQQNKFNDKNELKKKRIKSLNHKRQNGKRI